MLLECSDKSFCTAIAFGFADKGRRTGDPQKPQFLLKNMRHILTAMLMPEDQALGAVLPKHPKMGADPLADGLQGFKPGAMHGRMDAHTLGRTMIHRDKDGHLTLLAGEGGGHIGAPHRVDALGDDRPVMGFRAMGMPMARGRQHTVGTHQTQHPTGRCTDTLVPQPGPHLTVAFTGERRCLQDTPDMVHQFVIRTGTYWPPPCARLSRCVPVPVNGGAGNAPHTTDPRQAIPLATGGRDGLAHRLDLLCRKGWLVSSRPIFSRKSSISMVDSPSFSRRRPISRSRLSSGCCFIASWPASRKASRQVVRRAAGIPSSRDSRSSASPRSRRSTASVFFWAENRWGFFHPFVLPSPVALRAPCEGTSMDISCGCIWTPPVRYYTQIGVQSNCTPNHRSSSKSVRAVTRRRQRTLSSA